MLVQSLSFSIAPTATRAIPSPFRAELGRIADIFQPDLPDSKKPEEAAAGLDDTQPDLGKVPRHRSLGERLELRIREIGDRVFGRL